MAGRSREVDSMKFAVPVSARSPGAERSRGVTVLIAVGCVVLIAAIWLAALERIRFEQEQAVAAEIAKNDNLAMAHEERASRSIEVVDTLLRIVRADYLDKGTAAGLAHRLANLGKEARFIHVLSVIGPDGRVIATNVDMPAGANFAEREYFAHHVAHAEDELLIGPPIIGRVTGQQVVSMTRRIERPGGGFGGVVFLSMNPAFFSRLYERSHNGANGALALIGLDGITRVRRNGDTVSYGEDIRSSQLFKELPRARAGHYIANAASDGILRVVSYRQLEDFPLIVVVGSSLDELLAGTASRRHATLVAAAAASVLILALAALAALNVSRRARALAAVEGSEERYRLLFERSLDAILKISPEGAVIAANSAACQVFGSDEPLLLSLQREDLFDKADPRYGELMARLLQSEQVRGTVTMKRADGTRFEADISANLYLETDNRPVASLVVRDLTERLAAEGERLKLESQLREAQKLESLGTLAGGIAHDFNNILGSILGNVALAPTELPADSPTQTSLQQIRRASHRARDLVHQILAFSRRSPQSRCVHDVRTIVEETRALLRAAIPAGIDLVLRLDDSPMPVDADAGQIQQVLMNLGVNAWQAIDDAHGRIEIAARPVRLDGSAHDVAPLAAGHYVQLEVIDNGCGMGEALQARIFEPFFTTKPVGKGTGLGLAVVHGIVQAHGGSIAVESRAGVGTSFRIWLPIVEAPAVTAVSESPRMLQRLGSGQRVVFIDDDELMRLMAERLLVLKGYSTRCFDSAEAALSALSADPGGADLVITDFNMPGANGLELAQALAELVPGLPVIISSGYIDDALREEAGKAGVRALLHKETLLDTLGAELQRVLHSGPVPAGAHAAG